MFQEYFDKYLSPPKLSRPHQEVSSENSFCYHDEDERYSEDTSERYTNELFYHVFGTLLKIYKLVKVCYQNT